MLAYISDLVDLVTGRGAGDDVFEDILAPHLPQLRDLLAPLAPYRQRERAGGYHVTDEALWEWFALSVLNDQLLLPLTISERAYRRFFGELGFELFEGGAFCPMRHELVQVEVRRSAVVDVVVAATRWPGLMFGELVFARSGVELEAHPDAGLVPEIAETSTLYFTNQRLHRRVDDLSHGWGRNSRWRTRFHRNYREAGQLVFNADGTHDLADPASSAHASSIGGDVLPIEARRELLVHRCFVAYPGPGVDAWPYDDTLIVRGDRAWPLDERRLVVRPG